MKGDKTNSRSRRSAPAVSRVALWTAAAAGAAVACAAATHFASWLALHPLRMPVRLPDDAAQLGLREIEFASQDGTPLSGWFLEAERATGVVLLCHGHPCCRLEMLPWARRIREAGFHALLFDFRAMGRSGGSLCTLGAREALDIQGALDWLDSEGITPGLPAGAFGISMGGAAAILAAAADCRIRAVASHGAFASLDSAIRQRGRCMAGPAGPAVAAALSHWGKAWLDCHPSEVAPVAVVHQIAPRPVLLIHGAKDLVVSPNDARALFEAAQAPCSLRVFAGSWHIYVPPIERDAYRAEVIGFFRRNLAGASCPARPRAERV